MAEYRMQALQLLDACAEQAPSSDIRFFVSKQWLNKFNTFAEPGPIDNWALLCAHGALPPSRVAMQSQLVVALPQPLWEFLYHRFGGGPVCNHLYECDICQRTAEALARRQQDELNMFQRLKDETTQTLYAISMAWLRQWQIFVGGGDANDDPGPINNASIAGQQNDDADMVIRSVRASSDYAQINSLLWRFFHSVYGGRPTIVLRGNPDEKIEPAEYVDSERQDDIPPLIVDSNGTSKEVIEPLEPSSATMVEVSKPIKVTKNVSFEDDAATLAESVDSSYDASSSIDTVTSNGSSHSQTKISSHHNLKGASTNTPPTNGKVLEIVGKKEKRLHRSTITKSGLFGAEGMLK